MHVNTDAGRGVGRVDLPDRLASSDLVREPPRFAVFISEPLRFAVFISETLRLAVFFFESIRFAVFISEPLRFAVLISESLRVAVSISAAMLLQHGNFIVVVKCVFSTGRGMGRVDLSDLI